MLGVAGFQRSSITVKPRRSEEMGPIPIGEGERARWSFSTDRYTFKFSAWFVPNTPPVSPPPVGGASGDGQGASEQVPAPLIETGEPPNEQNRVEVLPERGVGDDEADEAGGESVGAFLAPTSGAIHFRVNNEFSRLRPKKVNYQVEVGGVSNGEVTLELDSISPSLRASGGFDANDRLAVVSTTDTGKCAAAGIAPTMVLTQMCGEPVEASSWANLEAQILAKSRDVEQWSFTFALPPPRTEGDGTPPRDADSPSQLEIESKPDPEAERRAEEVKRIAARFEEETKAEAALESGEQMPPPPGGNNLQTTMDMRPWKDRIHDATLAVQGQQLVLDAGRQYKRACAEHRRLMNEPVQGFLGRAFGGAGARGSGRGAAQMNQEATGQAAQQLRQAAEKLAQAGQYELAGAALRTKAELHERQQLPDAQVAALLAAAEQYRKGVGGGLGTGQGIRQELVAEAMRAYDMARDVRLMQARGGATRPLQQAADVQQLIVGTYKQARKWEEAAVAQLLLTDLRDGRIPQVEAEAADEEAMESPASGGGSPAVGSPAGRTATSSFAAKFADVAAKFGAVDK
jgi:hypothetical protein|eukprot:COSAG06_NODE_2648_length_6505_cov_2.884813_2_plen_573_part_00